MKTNTPEFKKLIKNTALLFTLTLLPVIVGKLLIPLDWYSFRCWETLLDRGVCTRSDDPRTVFYPDHFLKRIEAGDLSGHSRYAVKKNADWYTDSLGFRNKNYSPDKNYGIVVVGDSDIVGSALAQDETFTAVLQSLTHVDSYSWAPDNLNGFIRSPRFQSNPPKIVIMADNESNINFWPAIYQLHRLQDVLESAQRQDEINAGTKESFFCSEYRKWPLSWQIAYKDILKKPFLFSHIVRVAWLKIFGHGVDGTVLNPEKKMLFRTEKVSLLHQLDHQPERLDQIARAIQAYQLELAQRGILMIYMPIPLKESIYWDWLPEKLRGNLGAPTVLSTLVRKLNERGVPAIDLTDVFRQRHLTNPDELLYQLDDSHWNADAVRGAAFLVGSKIGELLSQKQ